jgi:CheY-like chemotaxis protein
MRIANANGGIEGLQAVRDFRPAAIVLDSILPDLSGWSVLAAVKSDPDLASTPVVLMAPVEDHDKARRMGAAECLAKPIDRNRLVAVIVSLSGANGRRGP